MSGKDKETRKLNLSRLRAGGYSALASVIVIVIAVFANLAVNLLPSSVTQLDMTDNGLYTLSDQTKRIVSSLDKDVDLYLLATSGKEDATVTRLLDRYAGLSSHIRVSCVDPNEQPTFLNAYDLTVSRLYANSVLVDCGGRYRLVGNDEIFVTDYEMDYYSYNYTTTTTFEGENALTNAIHYVSSDSLPKIFILTGHGEEELSDTLTAAIGRDNMETESLSLMTADAVPEDAAVIVINAPQRDLNADEAALLTAWLEKGGCVALTTAYTSAENMPNLLTVTKAMGLTVTDGIVIEGDSRMHYPRYPYYLLPEIGSHETTEALTEGGYYILTPLAQGLAETDAASAEITWLLTTSDSSYAKTAGLNMKTTSREDGDTDGPCHVGALSQNGGGKLFWVTSDGFLSENIDQVVSGANSDLFLNVLNWMADREESISIRAKSMDAGTLTVPASDSTLWSVVLIGVVPALLAAAGIMIRIRRKRR